MGLLATTRLKPSVLPYSAPTDTSARRQELVNGKDIRRWASKHESDALLTFSPAGAAPEVP